MKYALILICCMLAACSVHEDRDKEAGKILKSWRGQSVEVALDSLGSPTKIAKKSQEKVYLWITERDENVRIIGGREIVRDGFTDDSDPEHLNIKASCKIIVATDMEDIILGAGMKGQILTCSQFADTLLAAKINTSAK